MYGATIDQSTVQIQKVICIAGHMTSISANEITMTNTLCPHRQHLILKQFCIHSQQAFQFHIFKKHMHITW